MLALPVLLLALGAAAPSPVLPLAAAEVARQATRTCVPVVVGTVKLKDSVDLGYPAQLKDFGLLPYVDNATMGAMGRATVLLNRASLAHSNAQDGTIVLAVADPGPTCRVVLVGEPNPVQQDTIAKRLVSKDFGWREVPGAAQNMGAMAKRVFLRREESGKAVLLNLTTVSGVPGKVQLFATVVAVPAGVTLPAGY